MAAIINARGENASTRIVQIPTYTSSKSCDTSVLRESMVIETERGGVPMSGAAFPEGCDLDFQNWT